jgi:hypothetical protein
LGLAGGLERHIESLIIAEPRIGLIIVGQKTCLMQSLATASPRLSVMIR